MESTLTQEELREALLAALLDYESIKKTRRMKAVKKTLQGTMVATLIGSSGLMAASQGRSSPLKEAIAISANAKAVPGLPGETEHSKFIPGVAHFGFNKRSLTTSQEERLQELIKQLPKNSAISVVGRTDASGSKYYNDKLGTQRAQSVADYLSLHGFKIKAIGSRVSNFMPENWMMRRVDILVDSPTEPFFLGSSLSEKQDAYQQPAQTHTPQAYVPQVQAQPQALPKIQETYKPSQQQAKPQIHDNYRPPAQVPRVEPQVRDTYQPPAQIPQVKPQAPAAATTDAFGNRSNLIPKTSPKPAADDVKVIEQQSDISDATAMTRPEYPATNRQKVRGVTHFALNSHELAWAHKERLIELVKQLPKDSQLIVIGRTESNGAETNSKELGMLRAKTVATFLANFGIKVKAVGSKESSDGFTGWGARRVDIVIDSGPAAKRINLQQPVKQEEYGSQPKANILELQQNQPSAPDPALEKPPQRTPYLYKVD